MSPSLPHRTRHVMCLLAAGWLAALTWTITAGTAPAHAEDSSTTGFTVVVPTASPAPTPSQDPPARQQVPSTSRAGQGRAAGQGQGDPSAVPPTEPAIPSTPAEGDPAALDQEVYEPGASVTVTASGFDPNEQVQVVLYSDPILLGNFAADEAGDVSVTFTLPSRLLAGPHTVQLTGWASGHVATARFLLGSAPLVSTGGAGALPPWTRWAGGAVGAAGLVYGGRRLLLVMRAPASTGGLGGEVSAA